jgi:hypothetical protein
VAGGGNTNYVIAKDDIGNWYVKNYSADPKDVIHSAQGLALFAVGPAIGSTSLVVKAAAQNATAAMAQGTQAEKDQALDNLNKAQKVVGVQPKPDAAAPAPPGGGAAPGAAPPPPAGGPAPSGGQGQGSASDSGAQTSSVLERELTAAQKKYGDRAATDATAFGTDAESLKDKIKGRWQAEAKLAPVLDRLLAAADAISVDKPAAATDAKQSKADQAFAALQRMNRYFVSLSLKIRKERHRSARIFFPAVARRWVCITSPRQLASTCKSSCERGPRVATAISCSGNFGVRSMYSKPLASW